MLGPITDDPLVTAICAFFVMFYAFRRYDTPETNRLTTTRALFLITGAGYVLASAALFLVMCEIILRPGVLSFLGEPVEDAQKLIAKYSAPPILAAVVLTTLLPNIKFVSDWDAWLLKRFQAWGSIPSGVRNLADEVVRAELPSEEDIPELRSWMYNDGDVPNELIDRVSSDSTRTSRASLTRTLRLCQAIDKLGVVPAYARALRERAAERQAIRENFRVYTAISQAFFLLFDQLQPLEGPAGENAKRQARDRYEEISRKQSRSLAEFVAELLLGVEGSEQRIAGRLATIGLRDQEHTPLPLPIGPLVFMGVVIVVAILGIMSFIPRPAPHPGALPTPVVAVLIGLTKTIGALAAVLPKLCWSQFCRSDDGKLPYLSWLGWAMFATLISLVIERATLLGFVPSPSISAVLDFQTYPLTPMAPTTFVMCIAISILCDLELPLGDGWSRRIAEGGICGTAMVITLMICFGQIELAAAAAAQIPPLLRYGFPFFIGSILGVVAPYLYRKYRRPTGEDRRPQALIPRAA